MDQHKDNPLANQLPKGVEEDKLLDAVRTSGYPLQSVVARELSSHFTVVEEWGYKDKTENVHRTLDVYCFRELETLGPITPRVHLLIECKRSDLPYVFFVPGVTRLPRDFPEMLGFGISDDRGTRGPVKDSRDGQQWKQASRIMSGQLRKSLNSWPESAIFRGDLRQP